MSALKGMLSFFTMIRLDINEKDMEDMDRRFWLIPIIGLLYGLISMICMVVMTNFIHPLPSAVLTLFVVYGFSRFLHVDGTIDVGDGLVVSGTREDHLRALKDSRIGAGGMGFALMIILLSLTALASVPLVYLFIVPIIAEVFAKLGMIAAASFGTAGPGMAGRSVRNSTWKTLVAGSLLSAILVMVAGLALHIFAKNFNMNFLLPHMSLTIMLACMAVSIVVGFIMSVIAKRNFGMVNGDVLGATNEIARAAVIFTFLIMIAVI